MSRPPPSPIDYQLCSNVSEAARDVRDYLLDGRLSRRLGFDVEKVLSKNGWAVGSHVWRPALKVTVDTQADFDFVCIDQARLDLVKRSIGNLFDETKNSFGSCRYMFKGTQTVAMDVWRLPDGVSIAEHIKSFPDRHQGVAYAIGVPVDLALVRTTHDQPMNVRMGSSVPSSPLPVPPQGPIVSPFQTTKPKKRSSYYPGDSD